MLPILVIMTYMCHKVVASLEKERYLILNYQISAEKDVLEVDKTVQHHVALVSYLFQYRIYVILPLYVQSALYQYWSS